MNKQSYLQEIYEAAYKDELEKISGVTSEAIGSIMWAPIPTAIGAYLGSKKKKPKGKKAEEIDKKTWSNILIPGVGGYRMGRRFLGRGGKKKKD